MMQKNRGQEFGFEHGESTHRFGPLLGGGATTGGAGATTIAPPWSPNEVLELMLEFSWVDGAAAAAAAVVAAVPGVAAAAAADIAAADIAAIAVAAGSAVGLEFIWLCKSVSNNVVDIFAAVAAGAVVVDNAAILLLLPVGRK